MSNSFSGYREAAAQIRETLLFDETRLLLDAWLDLWTDPPETLPTRQAIDPTRMSKLLSRVYVMEHVAETGRLRYRIAGEEVNRRYDYSLIGKHLDEITDAASLPRIDAYFRATYETPAVVLLSGILFSERDMPGYGERLLMPIRDAVSGQPGILGMTYQKSLFPDAATARAEANRTLRVASLATGAVEKSDASLPRSR